MCLTAEALALFLNLLAPEVIQTEPDRIIIHATAHQTHWVAVGDEWCTIAPLIERG